MKISPHPRSSSLPLASWNSAGNENWVDASVTMCSGSQGSLPPQAWEPLIAGFTLPSTVEIREKKTRLRSIVTRWRTVCDLKPHLGYPYQICEDWALTFHIQIWAYSQHDPEALLSGEKRNASRKYPRVMAIHQCFPKFWNHIAVIHFWNGWRNWEKRESICSCRKTDQKVFI
jgi:hypothetical protein